MIVASSTLKNLNRICMSAAVTLAEHAFGGVVLECGVDVSNIINAISVDVDYIDVHCVVKVFDDIVWDFASV